MIFMGADSISGNQPLDEAVVNDLKEIDYAVCGPGLDVFVEVRRGKPPAQRYRFGFDETKKQRIRTVEDAPEVDRGLELPTFIRDSIRVVKHQRSDHSLLVLWGHAYDFAFGRSRTRSGIVDALDFHELSTILRHLQETLRLEMANGDDSLPTLDIIGFDACEVATVEMACQLHPFAKYLLGSQVGIPIPGWPYDRILSRLVNPQGDRVMAPAEFGAYAVRRFCESYDASDATSLTMIDLSRAPELKAHCELLALTLMSVIADARIRDAVIELFYRSQTADDRQFVDVADLCLNFVRELPDAFVVEAARALGDLLAAPHPPLVGESEKGTGRPLIVEHGRNAGELARLHGLSLYAPHVAPNHQSDVAQYLYEQFAFAQETRWSTLVRLLEQLS
jgi:hypothetical protein